MGLMVLISKTVSPRRPVDNGQNWGGKKEYLRFCDDLEDSCDCMQNHPSLCLCLKHTVMFQ